MSRKSVRWMVVSVSLMHIFTEAKLFEDLLRRNELHSSKPFHLKMKGPKRTMEQGTCVMSPLDRRTGQLAGKMPCCDEDQVKAEYIRRNTHQMFCDDPESPCKNRNFIRHGWAVCINATTAGYRYDIKHPGHNSDLREVEDAVLLMRTNFSHPTTMTFIMRFGNEAREFEKSHRVEEACSAVSIRRAFKRFFNKTWDSEEEVTRPTLNIWIHVECNRSPCPPSSHPLLNVLLSARGHEDCRPSRLHQMTSCPN